MASTSRTSSAALRELADGSTALSLALSADNSWPDLMSSLTHSYSAYKFAFNAPQAPIERLRSLPIPDIVLDASSAAPPGSPSPVQGLCPSIKRAWAALGTTLFLWDYTSPGGAPVVETFEHTEPIIDCAVVPPKKGVFNEKVFQLLVLATATSVSLICFAHGDEGELALYVPDHRAETGRVQVFDFKATSSGRIFARGSDACLYELAYQARPGWINGKCYLKKLTGSWSDFVPKKPFNFLARSGDARPDSLDAIAVDDARRALYTLHSHRDISVYRLPTSPGEGLTHVAHITDLYRIGSMQAHAAGMVTPHEFKVVELLVVPLHESNVVHLVAVTSRGDRFYFTHAKAATRAGYMANTSPPSFVGPTTLECLLVRTAPMAGQAAPPPTKGAENSVSMPVSTDYPQKHPGLVDTSHALLSDGLFLAAAPLAPPEAPGHDVIFAAARSTQTPKHNAFNGLLPREDLADTATDVLVPGTTGALAEAPTKPPVGAVRESGLYVHPLALQLLRPARTFLQLSSTGLTILSEVRPIDTLRALLVQHQNHDPAIVAFYNAYGRVQSCAMALAIAARNSTLSNQPGLGGEMTAPLLGPDITQAALRAFFDWGGVARIEKPEYPPLAAAATAASSSEIVHFSGRHDGLALYTSRLVRPFWGAKLFLSPSPVKPGSAEKPAWKLGSDKAVLDRAKGDLQELVVLLQRNALLLQLKSPSSSDEDARAQNKEKASFSSLQSLLMRTNEAVSFVLLLTETVGGVDAILSAVPKTVAEHTRLAQLTWKDLVTSSEGQPAARALVEALVDRSLAAGVGVDQVAHALQTHCPTLCSPSDVRLYRALDGLKRAKAQGPQGAHPVLVQEAYELLARSAGTLGMDKLTSVTNDFAELLFAPGAINLPLAAAQALDPQDTATVYFNDVIAPRISKGQSEPVDETEDGAMAYKQRQACYPLVIASLRSFDAADNAALNSGVQTMIDQAKTARDAAYHLVWSATDGLMQERVFSWLLAEKRPEQLLSIPPPTPRLIAWLGRSHTDLTRLDLLWTLHVRQGHSTAAARVLLGLAESEELDLGLNRRIQYLSLASSFAKASKTGESELAEEIKERLDVAKLQARMVEQVQGLDVPAEDMRAMLAQLDSSLLTVTPLFTEFAEPLQMWGMMILIMHVAEFHNEPRQNAAWDNLISQADDEAVLKSLPRWEHVGNKVAELVQAMTEPDLALPLEMILPRLEAYAFELRGVEAPPAGWAEELLVASGADAEAVLDDLSGLLVARPPPWDQQAARQHLLNSTAAFLSLWVEQAASGNGRLARPLGTLPAARVDDAIDALLLSGATEANTEAGRVLRDVQARVRAWF